jgi:hypothetical protein
VADFVIYGVENWWSVGRESQFITLVIYSLTLINLSCNLLSLIQNNREVLRMIGFRDLKISGLNQ